MATKTFDELWPLPPPEIVVISGEYGTGKSTLASCTGARPDRTIVFDFEKSQKGSAAQLGMVEGKNYFDMQSIMGKKHPGARPEKLYQEFKAMVAAIPDGEYDVANLDNASPLEDSIRAFCEANPGEFGKTAQQYQRMSGLLWGDVKSAYSNLVTQLASKVRMVCIIVHMRDKFVNNQIVKDPVTGKPLREPKGKETLDQLSSLFLLLESGAGGVPSAKVFKARLDKRVYVEDPENPPDGIPPYVLERLNGEPGVAIIPVLPLRLPQATWPAIRRYMREPADLRNPKPDETISAREISADDRLMIRARIAEAEASLKSMSLQELEGAAIGAGQKPPAEKAPVHPLLKNMPGTADGLKAAFEKAGVLDKARSMSKNGTSNADIWIALMSEQRAAQPVTA